MASERKHRDMAWVKREKKAIEQGTPPEDRRRRTEDEITEMRDEVSGEAYEREPYTLAANEAQYLTTSDATTINMLGVVLAILGVIMLLATVTSTSLEWLGTGRGERSRCRDLGRPMHSSSHTVRMSF